MSLATEVPTPRYDPYDADIDARAHTVWRELREHAPLYRNTEHDFYALSRYDDVLAGLTDTSTYSSAYGTVLELMTNDPVGMPIMIWRDPPAQTMLRGLVSRAFTPRTIASLEPRVRQICAELLDPLVDATSFDYVRDFAALLPPTVILALIGFPAGFEKEWTQQLDAAFDLDDDTPQAGLISETGEISGVLAEMVPTLVEQRRRDPQEDMLSVLVHAQIDGEDGVLRPLTQDELFGYILLIAGAGTETVAKLLSFAGVLLSEHQDQQALLRSQPERIPNAIEEILRFEAPSPVQARRLTRNVTVHGSTIAAGSRILLLNGSANRDHRHFVDPDRFDVTRSIDRHLSFGYGAHFCIGAALARLEARVALEETFRRFPPFTVDATGLQRVHTSTVRGYGRVPIVFDEETDA